MQLSEIDIHKVWQLQLFNGAGLVTNCGKSIQVLSTGIYNELDSGPDFFNANLIIDGVNWNGNVEIHINATDWIKHLHHFDEAYQSIILHVVWNDDMGVIEGMKYFPTLELRKFVKDETLDSLKLIKSNQNEIFCSYLLDRVNHLDWVNWKEDLLIDRFTEKSEAVYQMFLVTKSWEETAYKLLLQSFGAKVNKQPFGMLSNYLNYSVIKKERYNGSFVEALLLGAAGMLDQNFTTNYALKLQEEYSFLSRKHRLTSMQYSWWKYSRLRPINFPNLQLAILAQNIMNWDNLVGIFEQSNNWFVMRKLFTEPAGEYWDDKYKLDGKSNKVIKKKLGKDQLLRLYINAIVPFNIALEKHRGENYNISSTIDELVNLAPESNRITKKWVDLNIENESMWDSQSLIHLYNNYCTQKKCLNCNIGVKILKS